MKFRSKRFRLLTQLVILCAVAVLAAGCSDKAKVGSGVDTNIKDAIKNTRLGETTTTAPPVTAAPKQVGISAPSTTAKAAVTTTTAKAAQATTSTTAKSQAFQVSINGDKSGQTQIDPQQISVYVGTVIQFTNNDSVTRSVKSGQGASEQFQSPPIPPGGTFTYIPQGAGTIPIVDGTRPYATGTIYVSAR